MMQMTQKWKQHIQKKCFFNEYTWNERPKDTLIQIGENNQGDTEMSHKAWHCWDERRAGRLC